MTARLLALCFLLVGLASAPSAHAQASAIRNPTIETASYPDLIIRFEVATSSGELISSLQFNDISVVEDGTNTSGQLRKCGKDQGIAFVFVIDVSGSMRRMMPEIQSALDGFLSRLSAQDRVALVTFHDQVDIGVDFTGDRTAIAAAIQAIQATGQKTELFYGVKEGLELCRTPGLPDRRVLVLISDGMDEGGAYDINSCLNLANEIGVSIAGLGIMEGASTAWRNVQRLALETDGIFFGFQPGQNWSDKLDVLDENLEAVWEYLWTSTAPRDGSDHEVELVVRFGSYRLTETMQFASPPPENLGQLSLLTIGLIAAGVLVVAALIFFLVRRSRHTRQAEREAQEKERQEAEKKHREELDALSGELQHLKEEVETEKEQDSQPSPEEFHSRSAVSNKTMFDPGTQPTAPPMYRSASLVILIGDAPHKTFPLHSETTGIGRGDDNHIVLEEDRVSHNHACIVLRDGVYYLADLGSTNGTFAHGQGRIDPEYPIVLQDGQQFRVGGVELVFRGEA